MKVLAVTEIKEEKRQLFEQICPDIIYKTKQSVSPEDLKDAEVLLGNLPAEWINQSETIKFVQLDSAGADQYRNLRKDITLCNASGAYGTAISEHMLACTLASIKNLYRYRDMQEEHAWYNLGSVPVISNLKVICIGMGDIGSCYAYKMHMLGAEVYGVRRTVHDIPEYVKGMYTLDTMDEILSQCDIVALALPQTAETTGLFTYERLHHLKKGAVLINVGRGSAIVEKDLIRAMKEGCLSAACLDVTEAEPLPKNSPLWECDNIYITPHISGRFNAEVTYDKVIEIFLTNLKHYVNHELLEHIVDTERGY